jgi:hypothetical protein
MILLLSLFQSLCFVNTKHSEQRCVVKDRLRDSTRWDAVDTREGDIVIGSYARSGTTLLQQIVHLLIGRDRPIRPMREISPWVEAWCAPSADEINALPAPRILKTHLEANIGDVPRICRAR